ncbi:hypothetical protein HanRHA438_Chr03g0128981 [Helianthus annuus]|uniref:Uncharacterized protein n=1 Tax=Helianthus annuus TaxID=4232 RepID=A0A9K3NVM9_HELAN|nr:hypothetical protein HanXRQr2_Chr03g0117041 [Helianthus annuus]KAJ0593516.1 hypothetical protein HanHA300_Chr03g0097851 [Helianthus annuus]KAJ0608528.1 hypothetical protein HanHA89_Chr03g0109561 [Helianthus annuus]KAJ0768593.1 hypothetical protein HanLR1_Chr03g0102931 [Helianthus annuus]KAJ0774338.1 hypothetical protein HanOQP8_Chr03g0110411 [Helianthus annuus]
MKSPIKKLSGLGLTRHHAHPSPAQLDELSGFLGYMQYMKDCCDSLLSPTAATANSAYGNGRLPSRENLTAMMKTVIECC